jgi:DNA polymerase I-like protein with 3'-5' exonuclease and polymerase domains
MILTFDTETTTYQKGNPYSVRNRMVSVGWKLDDGTVRDVYVGDPGWKEAITEAWNLATVIVGFNLKFDLAWLRREAGLTVRDNQQVYDVQLAWFVLTNQQHRYPSLNQVLEYFNLPVKLDVVKTEYWDKGIDTPDIPRPILSEYLHHDVQSTYEAWMRVQQAMPKSKRKLVQLQMADLIVLHEMEYNGLIYDKETSLKLAEETRKELDLIDTQLTDLVGIAGVNFGSGDQLSAILYGGTIVQEHKEEYLFQYKDPKKAPAIKTRKVEREYPMPRLVEPLPRTELKKEGLYATNEPTLKSLKAKGKAKQIIDLVLKRAELESLVDKYYAKIPKIMTEMDWPEGEVHGNFNQCTVVTGRLSSDKPNLQNLDKNGKKLFYSRYD